MYHILKWALIIPEIGNSCAIVPNSAEILKDDLDKLLTRLQDVVFL